MTGVFGLRLAAVLGLAQAVLQKTASETCDPGKLAHTLGSSKEDASEALWLLCNRRYSKGVCEAASRTLSGELTLKTSHDRVSLQQFASTACHAVEAAISRQHSLLLRQRQQAAPRRDTSSEFSDRLEKIRASASAHRLSLDVARRYRGLKSKLGATAEAAEASDVVTISSGLADDSSLDDTLKHKSIPLPHSRFHWEYNRSNHSSVLLDQAVEDWKKEHRKKINISSPEIVSRANVFKKFVPASKANAEPQQAPAALTEATSLEEVSEAKIGINSLSSGATIQQVVPRSQTARELIALGVSHEKASAVENILSDMMPASEFPQVEIKVSSDAANSNPAHKATKLPAKAVQSKPPSESRLSVSVPFAAAQVGVAERQGGAVLRGWLARAASAKAAAAASGSTQDIDDLVQEVMDAHAVDDHH